MADISKITLPSGSTYDIKDAAARAAIAALQNTENVLSTDAASTPYGVQWKDGSTTITGTLVASAETTKKIYLVPNNGDESGNSYDEYLTVKIGNDYSWEKIGSTKVDLSGLGDLAYKNSATGSYAPSGTVTVTTNTTENKTAAVSPTIGDTTYTPSGTIDAPIISIDAAGSTTSINSLSSQGTLPSFTATVASENLTLIFDAGSLPSSSPVTVKNGDATYAASAPSFSGTGVRLVTDNIAVPNTYSATFSGAQTTITVS